MGGRRPEAAITTLSRRGFLQLAAATGAVALIDPAIPRWALAACGDAPGSVTTANIVASNATAEERKGLLSAIQGSWRRYLAMDVSGYRAYVTSDVTKMSSRWGAGGLKQGADAVAQALPTEWSAFEHPTGVIAESFRLRRIELWVGKSGHDATALYWVDVRGGSRWCYTDQGLVFQALKKSGGKWRIAHQIDSWNLNYNLNRMIPGKQTFPYDFVTPVQDMDRATAFYSEWCGEPELAGADFTQFELRGARFSLDRTRLGGIASITHGLPNGWAVFYVGDVVAERARLKAAGVPFLGGTGTTLGMQGADPYAVGQDPSGNPFVIQQRSYLKNGPDPSGPSGFTGSGPRVAAAKRIATAWLRTNGAELEKLYGRNGRYFDDTRIHVRGMEHGTKLAATLESHYWSRYDRGAAGLSADMDVSSLHVRTVGGRAVVSYQMELSSSGAHPFRDDAFVTHLLGDDDKPLLTMIVGSEQHPGTALSLDYSGYPVGDLAAAESFYRNTMNLGTPYSDSGYRGWWADSGVVFGAYVAKPGRDGLPRSGKPSGYMSFWIPSAADAYDQLRLGGSTFPLIPAINSKRGIDPEPGYTQVLATDSEGNAQVFTEYTGQ